MNSCDKNEKLLIDAGSATTISDLKSPMDLKQFESQERSPCLQAIHMANTENFPKLVGRTAKGL